MTRAGDASFGFQGDLTGQIAFRGAALLDAECGQGVGRAARPPQNIEAHPGALFRMLAQLRLVGVAVEEAGG